MGKQRNQVKTANDNKLVSQRSSLMLSEVTGLFPGDAFMFLLVRESPFIAAHCSVLPRSAASAGQAAMFAKQSIVITRSQSDENAET